MSRRLPIGAEVLPDGRGAHFRVWAPKRKRVEVAIEGCGATELAREVNGYFSGEVTEARAGARYRLRVDGGGAFPDPASRFQPEGPHGPSQIVDAAAFPWTDSGWRGCSLEGQVIYEMHIGTFTREGTWDAARRELPELARAGITAVELMPVADFPGTFGWGYDGVNWFAPTRLYGTPEDFRRFVDDAHRVGIGVVLDVVYNHFGPDGNYLREFADDYFTDKYVNEWGDAINYDGPHAHGMREFVLANAAYWAGEYHLDGLRLDATQQIFDSSPEHIVTALARAFREAAAGRATFIVAENESQESRLALPESKGGYGLDGLWNDDLHHSAMVAATGHNEAYYTDYLGAPQEFISAAKYGYLYQGQRYKWQAKRRGQPAWGLRPAQFVNYIQNHDQIANSGRGERLQQVTSPGRVRALTAYLLLAPGTPMLFQGQEFAASTPFHFFADHTEELNRLVREGRIQFLSQFPSLARPEMRAVHIAPGDRAVFERCKLDFAERETHAPIYRMHQDLMRIRREDGALRARVDGAVLSAEAFVLRYLNDDGGDRLLLVNLGRDLVFDPSPEPLLAPPAGRLWEVAWSSEDPAYGGTGTQDPDGPDNWRLPGQAALLLRPAEPNPTWQT